MKILFLDSDPEGGFVANAFDENHNPIPLESITGERVDLYLSQRGGHIEFPAIHPSLATALLAGVRPTKGATR